VNAIIFCGERCTLNTDQQTSGSLAINEGMIPVRCMSPTTMSPTASSRRGVKLQAPANAAGQEPTLVNFYSKKVKE